jgi:iron complex transport system permease protein
VTVRAKKRLVVGVLLVLAAAGFIAALLSGPVPTSFRELVDFLLGRGGDKATIFRDLRLTRALLAFVVGAALSLAGAILQGYFRNPMADPFIVGVSSGASLGAVAALAVGFDVVLVGFSGGSARSSAVSGSCPWSIFFRNAGAFSGSSPCS